MKHFTLPNKAELVEDAMTKAIELEHVVQFTYFKRHGHGVLRTFSPFAVDDEMGSIIGWDHDKDELRRFSTGKIAWPVEKTDDEYIHPREKD